MGKNVKTFFKYFINSLIPQAPFYSKLLRTSFTDSVIYFLSLIFILNFLFFTAFVIKNKITNLATLKQSLATSLHDYPDNLTIFIKHGRIFATSDRPYFMWLDYKNRKILFVVVDESATPDKIKMYNSMFLLTGQNLVVNNDKVPTKTSIVSLNHVDATLSKQSITMVADIVDKIFLPIVFLLIIVCVFIAPIFSIIFNMLILLLVALCTYFIFGFYGERHKFKKIYQISLHAATFPLVLFYAIGLFIPEAGRFNISFFLLLMIFTLCALYESFYDHPVKKQIPTSSHRRK